jgi:hypothetical protein
VIFDNTPMKSFMQVLFRATHWIRVWSQLQKTEADREQIKAACMKLEAVVMQLFAENGWRFSNRLCL